MHFCALQPPACYPSTAETEVRISICRFRGCTASWQLDFWPLALVPQCAVGQDVGVTMRDEVSQFQRVPVYRPPTLKVNSQHLKGRSVVTLPLSPSAPHTQPLILISCCPHSRLQGRCRGGGGGWGGVLLVMSGPSDVFMSLAESSVSPAEPQWREAEVAPPGLMDGWRSSPSAAPTSFIWQGRTLPTVPPIISQTSSDPAGEPPEPYTSIHAKRQIRNCLCNV